MTAATNNSAGSTAWQACTLVTLIETSKPALWLRLLSYLSHADLVALRGAFCTIANPTPTQQRQQTPDLECCDGDGKWIASCGESNTETRSPSFVFPLGVFFGSKEFNTFVLDASEPQDQTDDQVDSHHQDTHRKATWTRQHHLRFHQQVAQIQLIEPYKATKWITRLAAASIGADTKQRRKKLDEFAHAQAFYIQLTTKSILLTCVSTKPCTFSCCYPLLQVQATQETRPSRASTTNQSDGQVASSFLLQTRDGHFRVQLFGHQQASARAWVKAIQTNQNQFGLTHSLNDPEADNRQLTTEEPINDRCIRFIRCLLRNPDTLEGQVWHRFRTHVQMRSTGAAMSVEVARKTLLQVREVIDTLVGVVLVFRKHSLDKLVHPVTGSSPTTEQLFRQVVHCALAQVICSQLQQTLLTTASSASGISSPDQRAAQRRLASWRNLYDRHSPLPTRGDLRRDFFRLEDPTLADCPWIQQAISSLRELATHSSPFKKLECLNSGMQALSTRMCLRNHHQTRATRRTSSPSVNAPFDDRRQSVFYGNADELLPLLIYCLVQSSMPSPWAQLTICRVFVQSETIPLPSRSRYFVTMWEAAQAYLATTCVVDQWTSFSLKLPRTIW